MCDDLAGQGCQIVGCPDGVYPLHELESPCRQEDSWCGLVIGNIAFDHDVCRTGRPTFLRQRERKVTSGIAT